MPNIIKKKQKNSKTRKNKEKLIKATTILTPEQREIVCKTSSNTYNTFEDVHKPTMFQDSAMQPSQNNFKKIACSLHTRADYKF